MDGLDPAPGKVKLSAEQLGRALAAAEMVADCATVGIDEDASEFYVGATGDTDDVRYELPAAECVALEAGDAESTVSLSYLGSVEGAVPVGTTVTVALGRERPVEPAFDFAGGDGRVDYLVAPRRPVRR
jgi:proliferating cell nuclear antigen